MGKGSGNTRSYSKEMLHTAMYIEGVANKPDNDLPRNLQITFARDDEYRDVMMETYGNKITVNTATSELIVGNERFNPANSLNDAIKNIQQGKSLSLQQETAIEVLQHEAMHTQSPWERRNTTQSQLWAMESVNEFLAYMSYPSLLRSMGSKAVHTNKIEQGLRYGAKDIISGLRDAHVNLDDAYTYLRQIHESTKNPRTYKSKVIYYLKDKNVKNAERIFD